MQNFEKMEWRISSDAMVVPVISDKWWMHSRKSWAIRSDGILRVRPSMTRVMAACACFRAW